MKPNLEISLKFWAALIVFFAVVLSLPAFQYFNIFYNLKYNDTIALMCVIDGLLLISFVSVLLRYKELKSKLNKETFFKDVSMQTIEDYETQIKEQENHIKELKKSFEDAVVEITELRVDNKNLNSFVKELIEDKDKLKEQIIYWKERALHQKHTKKEVENNVYLCIKSIGEYFIEGKQYNRINKDPNFLYLIGETKLIHIVNRTHFKPVTNGN